MTARPLAESDVDLTINCLRCRLLLPPDPQALARRPDADRPVDELVFRCRRCERLGEPNITAPGNATVGRKRIWPPEGATP
ncbi:MAG: hypothetical protein ACREEB_18490 [Caulobacteraceae bacterium]